MDDRKIAVFMRQITKDFPGVRANDAVDFKVAQGEIHGLLGENGAGKSVLMGILYGLYQPTSGEIFIHGRAVAIRSPAEAIALKIGMVHQHFMLISNMTVAENIVLGFEPDGYFWNRKEIAQRVAQFAAEAKLPINPEETVGQLSVGAQQRVEILKVLYRQAQILILDEPTAVLTPQETEALFRAMRALRDQGKTIIFIAHKLKEVLSICDRITVLCRGKLVGTEDAGATDESKLAEMIVGTKVVPATRIGEATIGDRVLEVKDLTADGERGERALEGLSFELRAGEILGIAGVEGNGQTELVEVLTGLRRPTGGKVFLSEADLSGITPRTALDYGIRHIPEDKRKRGIIPGFSVKENLILGDHCRPPFKGRFSWLMERVIRRFADKRIEEFQIQTPSRDTPIDSLSGGNQQRLIVGRVYGHQKRPTLLIAAQPTCGLDVQATRYVRQKLIELSDQGAAVLLVSADLDEVMAISDRILVIHNGRLHEASKRPSRQELGLLMIGGREDE
ncbi:MAG: Galactose/methyl galactoside import ATP-binding protein MglA [Chloroflexi bacterium]|nr:Galactose/methyl galactoside import ATP-binding protein MglA [Chloroflexota bacterium]